MEEISLFGSTLFNFYGLNITNTFLLSIVTVLVIILLFVFGLGKKSIVPNKIQNFFEFILETLFNIFNDMTGNRKKTEEIFPLSATLFILILSVNLIELIPGLGIFHFLRAPSSDLHFTFALAIFAMLFVHLSAISQLGGWAYLKKYIKFESPVMFFVGILEAIGELTKTLSLGIRLFGNLFAGEILLMVIYFFIFPYIVPLPFLGLELFVAFIQALVFSALITVFYVLTTSPEEH